MISLREATYDSVSDAQTHFRVLLDSMAHPGLLRSLDTPGLSPPGDLSPAAAAIALALLNADVTFAGFGIGETAIEYIRQNTYSLTVAGAGDADFLFLRNAGEHLAAIAAARSGLPAYPETGATAVIQLQRLDAQPFPGSLAICVAGPGVDGTACFHTAGVSTAVLATVSDRNDEYPLGIDIFFTCGERVVSIPRSCRMRCE